MGVSDRKGQDMIIDKPARLNVPAAAVVALVVRVVVAASVASNFVACARSQDLVHSPGIGTPYAVGMSQATANPATEPLRWQMLHHPSMPQGRAIPAGPSILRVANPVRDLVLVVFAQGDTVGSFFVNKGEMSQHNAANGTYRMYFIYGDEPDALYQGDDVSVYNQISTITLQLVANGNYNIRRVH